MSSRILLEADNLTLPSGTGIATYARNLAGSLRDLGHATDVVVGVRRQVHGRDPVLNEVGFYDARALNEPFHLGRYISDWLDGVHGNPFGVRPGRLSREGTVLDPYPGRLDGFGHILTVPRMSDNARYHFKRYGTRLPLKLASQPDLFHATQAIPLQIQGRPNVYTIHDLVPLRLPYTTLDDKKYVVQMLRCLTRHADHIVTVSEFSKRDIMQLLGVEEARITNTYQAVSLPKAMVDRPEDAVAGELAGLFGLDYKDYYLFVGAIEPKKNLRRLIDAFAASGTKRRLIIAGSDGWMSERDLQRINDERFLMYRRDGGAIRPVRQVQRVSYLPLDHLVSLMRGARALLFPSLYEGFGLPVLEAMSLGTPVMTANVSSLPEIAGDAALMVSPTDIDAMARAIRAFDSDPDLRADLAAKGRVQAAKFSPEIYRDRLARLYGRLL